MKFSRRKARALLESAQVFFADEDDTENSTLNLSDVWCWACADAVDVSDDEIEEVAELFWKYGWCGILYWAARKQGIKASEFMDNNRFIEFVESEEAILKEIPDSTARAYTRRVYTLGRADRLEQETPSTACGIVWDMARNAWRAIFGEKIKEEGK